MPNTMDLTGRVLSNRYRLISGVGMGSSGVVYAATDVNLKRQVAVKVLHCGYNADLAFLRRFRAEAQLAANLHHHNIVSVFDWGEDEVPYLVLELLEGGSLRSMLDEGVRLTPAQACHVGMQVCAALEYSHTRSIVHRDIKPANLLFDEHGVIRVADFGLARALAEASFTEPSGAVIGTARYASPEQASGVGLDGRSDLYSLALVLHEAVTGEVPFAGDTITSTLAARIKNDIVANKKLGVLGSVVERAGCADPDQRYPDAKTMFKALSDIAQVLPKPGPLTLVPEDGQVIDPNPTNIVITPTNLFDQEANGAGSELSPEQVSEQFHKQEKLDRHFGPRQLIGAGIFTVILAILIAGMFSFITSSQASVIVPNVAGLQKDVASAKIATTGLRVKFQQVFSDDPVSSVISTTPNAGSYADSSGTVTLVLSRGPKPIDAVDVMKEAMSPADAKTALEALGFIVVERREFNETILKDNLISTDPGTSGKLPPETVITLVISDGPTPIAIPNVAGKTYDEAANILTGSKFTPARKDEFSDTVASGTVISTSPGNGEKAQKGSTITIIVSKGPDLITVPSLVGSAVDDASAKLTAIGLVPEVQGKYKPKPTVAAMDPVAGSKIKRGSSVTLFLK